MAVDLSETDPAQKTLPAVLKDVALSFALFLDRKVAAIPVINAQDLADNGSSGQCLERIKRDAALFQERITQKTPLILEDHENEASIRDKLKKIVPDASEVFLSAVAPKLFLIAQTRRDSATKDARVSNSSSSKPASELSRQWAPSALQVETASQAK